MSKEKSRDTIRLQNKNSNKKHNMPRELVPVVDKLNSLEFVVCIGTGIFSQARKKNEINIIGFDDSTNSYVIKVSGIKYEQKLFVKVCLPKECEELEEQYNKINNSKEKIENIKEGYEKLKNLYEERITEAFYN